MNQVRILIAEDNELVALTLEEQILSLGFAVAGVARNGKEAIQMCEQLTPDVVLMDMQMPEMAGDVAAKQITQRCPRPIIMLTAFSDPELNCTLPASVVGNGVGANVQPRNSGLVPLDPRCSTTCHCR